MPRRWATKDEPQIMAVSSINKSARRAWLRMVALGWEKPATLPQSVELDHPILARHAERRLASQLNNKNRKANGRIRDSHCRRPSPVPQRIAAGADARSEEHT